MNPISGMYGYPNPYQVLANPTGAGLTSLNAEYARDFGISNVPVYDLPINVNMGFNQGGAIGGSFGMNGYMNPYMMNPYMMQSMMMSPSYREYLQLSPMDRLQYDYNLRNEARELGYNEGIDAKNYAAATDGLTGSIREACNSLQTVIIEGETDQIARQFEGLVDMLRRSPLYERLQQEFKDDPVVLEKTLRNAARDQFQAVTGQDLKAMIQDNCDSALANAFFNTISFGNAQTYSTEDLIAKIEGSETPKSVRTKQVAGKTGGVLATTGAGAAVGAIGGPVGALIGAGVGAVVGIFGALAS